LIDNGLRKKSANLFAEYGIYASGGSSGNVVAYGAELFLSGTYPGDGNYKVIDPNWRCFIRILNLEVPANKIILADSSYNPGRWGTPIFQSQVFARSTGIWDWATGPSPNVAISVRHTGLANVLFADGHVEAATTSRLKECGISRAFTRDSQVIF